MNITNWPIVQVRTVCELIVDCVNRTAPLEDGVTPYRMIRTTDIRDGKLNFKDSRYVNKEIFDRWTRRASVETGDVLLTREAPIGEVCRIPNDENHYFLGQRIMQYRADPKQIDPLFLYYSFCSNFLKNQFLAHDGSGSVVSHIRVADCHEFKIPLAPISEQSSIGRMLAALDDKIDLNRRTNETLEAMARALFRDWFVDFGPTRAKMAGQMPYLAPELWELFPDRLDDEGKPEGWSMFPLSNFCSLKKESLSPEKTPEIIFSHFSIPAFDKGGMPDLVYGEQIKSGKFVVPDDSILLSKLNPETPRIWFIPNNHTVHPQICSTEFMVLLPQTRELREFIYCAVSAKPFHDLLKSMVTGTSKSHQRVQPSAVMTIDCVLADRKLPLRFGSVVSSFFSRMERNMIENQNLAQLRDLLLPKLMSGEIRIRDAEKMVADAL